jgi:hypothetical protein
MTGADPAAFSALVETVDVLDITPGAITLRR